MTAEKSPRILVTGGTGQLGRAFQASKPKNLRSDEICAPTRSELDLAQPESIQAALRKFKPDIIMNAGAYTAVDRAEDEPDLAYAINGDAMATIGAEAKKLGAYVLHYSTDYVFSGEGTVPWRETDIPAPQNIYGRSKLAGEEALRDSGAAHVILRTSWVWGIEGHNFFRAIYKRAASGQPLRIVNDQIGAPTSAAWLAELAWLAIKAHQAGSAPHGVFHAQAQGYASWYEVAEFFFKQLALPQPAVLEAISSDAWPAKAKRPLNSRLDCTKLEAEWGITRPLWQTELANAIPALIG